jgi:transcriptional regulator with XRE-family HTH domain
MERRVQMVREEFPTVVDLDWKAAFDRDFDLFARIMQAISQLGQVVPRRSGPRPEPDYDRALVDLRQLMGQDYTALVFAEAFAILADRRSLTQLGRKCGMDRMRVLRLKRGDRTPHIWEMEQIAEAFGKHPSFFVEYRCLIAGAILSRLEASPETSVHIYRKLVGAMS